MADYDDFWEYSEELSLVRKFAYYHIGSPWAYLGSIMARAVASVPYNVVLPAIIGDRVSSGLYVAVVGDPGHGKDSSGVASNRLMPCDAYTARLGSGEGITHQYAYTEKGSSELNWTQRSILFESSEAETLKALKDRNSSTLMGELRSAWMGQAIGFGYSDVRKRLMLPALSYRLSLIASFTPSMGDVILDGISEGTPQRFLFMPTHDAGLPDEDKVKKPRKQLMLNIPPVDENGYTEIAMPGWVGGELRDDQRSKVRREMGDMTDKELLDTHVNLVRLKVAFALGLMLNPHRRHYMISEDDWDLSEFVMDKSRETRDRLIEAAEIARHKKDKKEGKSLGVKFAASDELRKFGPVADRIVDILKVAKKKKKPWMSGGNIRNLMSPAQRKLFDEAMQYLVSSGRVQEQEQLVANVKDSDGEKRPLTFRFRLLK